MNNRRSTLSFISDRTIGTKVSAGFAVVLLILAVSSALAWLAFGRTSGAGLVKSAMIGECHLLVISGLWG